MARPTSSLPRVQAAVARRLLLDAQGLLADPRRRATAEAVYEIVEGLGFVQIDSINVVERAHHLTLAARLQGYRPALLERLLERDRRLFEHWTHDASAIPTAWFPHWRHRFERYRREVLRRPWWRERIGPRADEVIARVRERIHRQGPLRTRDLEGEPAGGDRAWWGWTPEKTALEYLWRTGEAAVAGRESFHKVYDLTERVLPREAYAAAAPGETEHVDWACRTALQRLGTATPEEIAAFWNAVPAAAARAWCERAGAVGGAEPVLVEAADGSRPGWAVADWRERAAAAPTAPRRLRLLSPFDPVLRDRRRTLRLFGFDYRFEAFVPARQRRYGYYVLPILEGERLVGRLDPKLHRGEGLLEVREVWWEPGVPVTKQRRAGLEAAVARLARFTGAERWSLPG